MALEHPRNDAEPLVKWEHIREAIQMEKLGM
jgi:hypothetical protein